MSITKVEQAYELVRDVDHLNKLPHHYDACIVEWPEYREYSTKFVRPAEFEYPSHGVEFHGCESCLSLTDYPCTSANWPIMSKRILNTLLEVKEFPHRTWDVLFVGFPDNVSEELLRQGLGKGIRHDDEFVAVQLLEQLDIFDWENSVYKMKRLHDEAPEIIQSIRNLALHVPEEGLPPIFRLKVFPNHLYVSPEGRAALETANIKGIRFV
jgi:hypothetical protein